MGVVHRPTMPGRMRTQCVTLCPGASRCDRMCHMRRVTRVRNAAISCGWRGWHGPCFIYSDHIRSYPQ